MQQDASRDWNWSDSPTRFFFFFRYLLQYQEPIPCEQRVTALCDIKQAYTQFGGESHRRSGVPSAACFLPRGFLRVGPWLSVTPCVCADRQEAVRRVSALHGLGPALRLPAVPERPQWQLRRLEGDLHRQQQRREFTSLVWF